MNINIVRHHPILLLSFIVFVPMLAVASMTPEQIMEKSHHKILYQGDMKRASVKMKIIDANGNVRKRQFYTLRLDKNSPEKKADRGIGEQYYYIYFRRPGDIKKTAFLVHKKQGGADDRWLYLPGLDLIKRIAAGDKRTSFVGSTLFYEDVSGRDINADTHEITSEDDTYFVIKSTPKKPDDVEFNYYQSWVHKLSFMPVRIEYFDKNNEKYRVGENQKVETIEGRQTVTKGQVTDLKRNEKTVVEWSKVTYEFSATEDIFSERYLRNPPLEYFK